MVGALPKANPPTKRRIVARLSSVEDAVRVQLGLDLARGRSAAEQHVPIPDFPAPQVGRDGVDIKLVHGRTSS